MKLVANKAMTIPFNAPFSNHAGIRVVATWPVTVSALREEWMTAFRTKDRYIPEWVSPLGREHSYVLNLLSGTPWRLIIENPWSFEVEVQYSVHECVAK